jgi:hypothetical protein
MPMRWSFQIILTLQQNLHTLIFVERVHSTWWHGWLSTWEDRQASMQQYLHPFMLREATTVNVQLHTWDAYAASILQYLHPLMMKAHVTSRYVHETIIPQPWCHFNSTYGLVCWESAARVVCKNTAAILNNPVIVTVEYLRTSMLRGVDSTFDVHLCRWDNLATTIWTPFKISLITVLTSTFFWCREEASTAHVAGSSICENTMPPPSFNGNNTYKLICGWEKSIAHGWRAVVCVRQRLWLEGSFVNYTYNLWC